MEKHLAELDPEVAEIMVGVLCHFMVEKKMPVTHR